MKFSDLATPALYADPYPTYEELHADAPLLALAPGVWITGDYQMIDALLRDRRVGHDYLRFIKERYGEEKAKGPRFQSAARMMITNNPPSHTRVRGVLMKAFDGRQVDEFRHLAQETADDLASRIERSGEGDLMTEFALPLTIHVICRLLNTPYEDTAFLNKEIGILARGLDAAPMDEEQLNAGNNASLALQDYFRKVLQERRKTPGDDLVSRLLTLTHEGESCDDEEIISNIIMLFMAGHETTANMLGNALIALYRNPDQLTRVLEDDSLIADTVVECLRYDTSVQMVRRVALEEVQVNEHVIPSGSMLFLCLGAAGRDPKVFDQADKLIIGRPEKDMRSLAFAGGIHHCLGARLAQIEIEVGLGTLLKRLPNLQLTNIENLKWHQRNTLRGVETLSASWNPPA